MVLYNKAIMDSFVFFTLCVIIFSAPKLILTTNEQNMSGLLTPLATLYFGVVWKNKLETWQIVYILQQ